MSGQAWAVMLGIALALTLAMAVAARERHWFRLLGYFLGSLAGVWVGHQVATLWTWYGVLIVPAVLGGIVGLLGVSGLLTRLRRRRPSSGAR